MTRMVWYPAWLRHLHQSGRFQPVALPLPAYAQRTEAGEEHLFLQVRQQKKESPAGRELIVSQAEVRNPTKTDTLKRALPHF
jgi:hypothetical protein